MRPDLWALNLASSQLKLKESFIVFTLCVFPFSLFFFILWLKQSINTGFWRREQFEPFKLCNYSIKAVYLHEKCI